MIAVLIKKGGAGKTTLVLLLADAFSRFGLSVLMVDTDAQGNLSTGAGRSVNKIAGPPDPFGRPTEVPDVTTVIEVINSGEPGVAAHAMTEVDWDDYRDPSASWFKGGPLRGRFGQIWIIPCYEMIETIAKTWTPGDLAALKRALTEADPAEPQSVPPNATVDVVLLDTPPGGSDIGRQAAKAASLALMVTTAEKFGIGAIPTTLTYIEDIRRQYDHPDLELLDLLINEYKPQRTGESANVRDVTEAQHSGTLPISTYPHSLPERTVIPDSQSAEAPVSAYLASSDRRGQATRVCIVVEALALDLLDRMGHPLATQIRAQWEKAWGADRIAEALEGSRVMGALS
ncbi:ParA family protein [Phytomonospora sp. NPDC050363]|uniref:ParA family protein n=1 Tax=Phytomonospora sp. NPDC050363 TaxID=3155642 RepID=UPI00340EDD94